MFLFSQIEKSGSNIFLYKDLENFKGRFTIVSFVFWIKKSSLILFFLLSFL